MASYGLQTDASPGCTAAPSGHAKHADPASEPLTRGIDLVLTLGALIFLAPLMLLLALLVRMSSKGPVFFKQQRVGRGGRLFSCYKFRTMRTDAEQILVEVLRNDATLREEWARDHKLRNDPRLAPLGSLLRRTSLDELPQLFNVLKGEMSIVGPRPITQSEVVRYGRYIRSYQSVRPGITGLWQVSGRSETTYRRRVACDVAYARGRSPLCNIQIIARTVPAVFLSRGAC
ncbi:sugar transferase [bacterium]|nr:MAG: sugar transferase [bacterium]